MNNYDMTNTEFFDISQQNLINTNNGFNGRVFLEDTEPVKNFELYKNSNEPHYIGNGASNILETNNLTNVYFNKKNIDKLQEMIRRTVYNICEKDNDPILRGYKPIIISRQNDTEVQIVMRSIYLQYGRNLNTGIESQVNKLNRYVVNETVPNIITALKQKIKYLDDIQKLPVPLDRPEYNISKQNTSGFSNIFHNSSSNSFDLF